MLVTRYALKPEPARTRTPVPSIVYDNRFLTHCGGGPRTVDCAIMPTVAGGNANAPVTLIGGKGAAMILVGAQPA